ncbi:MAG: GNAT family N-acetyltransferase [Saprospiraceae bacterium]|nr:GNAT family N-acetyltransferase [Candidatus Opimibacter iunctus]
MKINIRKADSGDLGAIHSLVRELAEYERGLDKVTTTPESYRADFARDAFEAFVAEMEGEIVGMALYCGMFSTWRGRMLYLEDFIVKEAMRGHGIGKLLFEAFLEEARRQEVALVKWQVLNWNEPGLNFYRKYETSFDDEWVDCKIFF